MITLKLAALKPLLESKKGVHLTAYLVNRRDLIDLKSQIRNVISEAYEYLNPIMSVAERKQFLEPLDALLLDARIFKQMKGNVGIFRNKDSFRVLNLPVEVKSSCQIATSFHVKPLLRWLQNDQDFLFLGLDHESAHLYFGSQDSFKKIDSILFPESFKMKESVGDYTSLKEARLNKAKKSETFLWVNDWILNHTKNSKPKLFIAGEPSLVNALNENLSYSQAIKIPILNTFRKDNANEICRSIRNILKADSQKSLEASLLEFHFAEAANRTQKNIFQIAKDVVQGKVKKLIVTDEVNIFGKIDPKSGELSIHPYDFDHEDDCVLDDLAQMVIIHGGEVIIAKKDEIPKGRPILALLNSHDQSLEKTEKFQYEVLKERFG